MKQFALLLKQDGAFKGLIVCTPNSPDSGIWYFSQGSAKPPLPVSAAEGIVRQQGQGPTVLIQDETGNLLAVIWNLDYATARSGATGPFASPGVNGTWQFVPLGGESVTREYPEVAGLLRK